VTAWRSALTDAGIDYARADRTLDAETNVYRF